MGEVCRFSQKVRFLGHFFHAVPPLGGSSVFYAVQIGRFVYISIVAGHMAERHGGWHRSQHIEQTSQGGSSLKQKKRKRNAALPEKQAEKRKPKTEKRLLLVRIVAGLIAFLMIASVLFSVVGT